MNIFFLFLKEDPSELGFFKLQKKEVLSGVRGGRKRSGCGGPPCRPAWGLSGTAAWAPVWSLACTPPLAPSDTPAPHEASNPKHCTTASSHIIIEKLCT